MLDRTKSRHPTARWTVSLLVAAAGCGSKLTRPEVEMPAFADVGAALGLAAPNDARPLSGQARRAPGGESVRTPLEGGARQVTEEDIRRAAAESRAGSGPEFPLRLLVIEVERVGDTRVEARPLPAFELSQYRAALEEESYLVRSVDTLPSAFVPVSVDLASLRYEAARFGAQALLVLVRGSSEYDFANGWAFLYPTVVGLAFAPGQSREVWLVAVGVVVDVDSGRPLGVVEAESRHEAADLVFADEARVLRELEREAQGELFRSLAARTTEALELAVAR